MITVIEPDRTKHVFAVLAKDCESDAFEVLALHHTLGGAQATLAAWKADATEPDEDPIEWEALDPTQWRQVWNEPGRFVEGVCDENHDWDGMGCWIALWDVKA